MSIKFCPSGHFQFANNISLSASCVFAFCKIIKNNESKVWGLLRHVVIYQVLTQQQQQPRYGDLADVIASPSAMT